MSDIAANDPNSDLIGYEFLAGDLPGRVGRAICRVIGSASWNPAYVEVERTDGSLTVRVASQIRQAKLLNTDLPEGAVVGKLPILDAIPE